MASTGKTKNLGLCQWEAFDPFLREDMNDTLKTIDTEIETRTTKKKLFDVTVEESVPALELDFTGIDTNQFMELEIFLNLNVEELSLRINGDHGNIYSSQGTNGSHEGSYCLIANGLNRLSFGRRYHVLKPAYPISLIKMHTSVLTNIDTMYFYGGSATNIYKGDRFIIWGVLK